MTNSSPPMLSQEEQEQLLQTIEMFEVIVQANPHDTQSLEILKDAYSRLGMKREMMKVSRRMAQTYTELGQFATAIVEYEHILREEPDNPEVIAALGDCEEKMHKAASAPPPVAPSAPMGYSTDGGGLITTSATHRTEAGRHAAATSAAKGGAPFQAANAPDANESLAKFLSQNRLAPEDVIQGSLERVQKVNASLKPGMMGISLINEIIERGGADLDAILCGILDRTKFSYIPLEYYDVDRHVVRMLPEDLTLSKLLVPFDVVSRTMMIATANPFDAAAKDAAQSLLDYNIQWHVASPQAIMRILSQAYKVGATASVPEPAPAPAPRTEAPVFGDISVPLPIPELKVTNTDAPLTSGDSSGPTPLPDTSDFRLKK